jgi:uncharacterized membrane protein YhaH (DUF805 family)
MNHNVNQMENKMKWFLKVVRDNYANFKGRAQRKEFWMFQLFAFIFAILLVIIDGITGSLDPISGFGLFSGIFTLALIIPTIAVGVRRLHDTGRSGWWYFAILIPLLGLIVLIFWCFDSDSEENKYGENPKEAI